MSEFDEWFKAEMPNSHKKVNKERMETVIYSCAEASWNHQQAKIDCMQVKLNGANERAMSLLNHKNRMVDKIQAKIDELQAKYDELNNRATGVALDQMATAKLNYELQARVDEIVNHVDINFDECRDDDQHSYWSGYNQAMRELNYILKGNKDENN